MASVKVTTFNGVKVYNVTAGKTLPQWLSEKKKKALRKDKDYRNRIELVQVRISYRVMDFAFYLLVS